MASDRDNYFEQQHIAYLNICKTVGLSVEEETPDNIDILEALNKFIQRTKIASYQNGYSAALVELSSKDQEKSDAKYGRNY